MTGYTHRAEHSFTDYLNFLYRIHISDNNLQHDFKTERLDKGRHE